MRDASIRSGSWSLLLSLFVIGPALPAGTAAAQVSGVGADSAKLACRQIPRDRVPFTEEAAARGLDYIIAETTQPNGGIGTAAFVDLDSDGDPDIVAVGESSGMVGVYENDGAGNFINRSKSTGIALFSDMGGVCAADYDADGDMDIFISRVLEDDVLLRNDGGFAFTDVTATAGVAGEMGAGDGSAWGDYDGDGWLDLLVGNRTGSRLPDFTQSTVPNRLYRNNGDGTFTDVALALGIEGGMQPTLTTAFVDYDLDGDADIYVGNDKGTNCIDWQNYLFRNNGDGTFTDVTAESGAESCTDTMSIAIGDFDANGYPDFYCTNTPPPPGHALILNNGDGTFQRMGPEAGVTGNQLGWGANFMDHDNDGVMGIYVVHSNAVNMFFEYADPYPCPELGAELGLDYAGVSYNSSIADIDADGDLDILVQDITGPLRLFVNHDGSRRGWIRFNVVGDPPNRDAVGAIVSVLCQGDWQTAEVLAGGNNYRSQNELAVHYGLDDACMVDIVQADWPDGQSRMLTNYSGDTEWTLIPPSMLGDANADGRLDFEDIARLVAASGPVRPGAEALDINGDARIDVGDLVMLFERMSARR